MKICYVATVGGHLNELYAIAKHIPYKGFLITSGKTKIKIGNKYYIHDKRDPFKIIYSWIKSFFVLLRERPDIIITTGAGPAIPVCYIGKLFGCKVVYIESYTRVHTSSSAGRLVYPIADRFYVQWETTKQAYGDKARYGGGLL